jgi:ATP-dependent helicase/nuclease subunit B
MCREDGAPWVELEQQFGRENERAVIVPLLGGRIKLQGRIDRVDELDDGRLLIIDYKTGNPTVYRGGPFEGGRKLQHYLYAVAVEELLGKQPARMEYRFPTARAAGDSVVTYDIAELSAGKELISALLDNIAAGRFMPTADDRDCTFCDFRTCCRVAQVKNRMVSPLAAWATNYGPLSDEYRAISELKARFK